jgi:hypothetical protein
MAVSGSNYEILILNLIFGILKIPIRYEKAELQTS